MTKQSLAIFSTATFLALTFIDETGVAVTLQKIQQELSIPSVDLNWIMNGFFLALAVCVLGAGKMSDLIGHRKVFNYGLVIFALSSLIATISNQESILIAARVIQGIGASLMLSTYAVLLGRVFPTEKQGLALGSSAAIASLFLATGPLIGGLLSNFLSWRVLFAINVPICIAVGYAVKKSIPSDTCTIPNGSFDWAGFLTFSIGFGALVLALMQSVTWGWGDSKTLIALFVGLLGLILFVWIETHIESPLADLKLFCNLEFLSANMVLMTAQVCALVVAFWAIWLEIGMGMSPMLAGIALLPAGLPILLVARWGGVWVDKEGSRPPIVTGAAICFLSMAWMAYVLPFGNYWLAMVGMVLYAIGAPLVISPAIKTVLMSVPIEKGGAASGILNTMRNLGAALCFALVGTAINLSISSHGTTQGGSILKTLLQGSGTISLENNTRGAFIYNHASGFGMWVAATFALLGLIFVYLGLPKKKITYVTSLN